MNKNIKYVSSVSIVAFSLLVSFLIGSRVGYRKGYNKCLMISLTSTASSLSRELLEFRKNGLEQNKIKEKEQNLQVALLKLSWNADPKEYEKEDELQEAIVFVKKYRSRFPFDSEKYLDTNSLSYFWLKAENDDVNKFLNELPVSASERRIEAHINDN